MKLATASLAGFLLLVSGPSGQSVWPANMVRVDVIVEEPGGRSVSGSDLTLQDFTLAIDGAPVPIARLERPPLPLTVTVLVDVTASMPSANTMVGLPSSAKPGERIAVAVEEFRLRGLLPKDRVRVGAVTRKLLLSERFETDPREWRKDWHSLFALPPVAWLGPSPIWDAIAAASSTMANESGQRAIVLVTDGRASGNVLGARDAAERAALAGVSVNFVLHTGGWPPRPLDLDIDPVELGANKAPLMVANETGGITAVQSVMNSHNYVMDRADVVEHLIDRLHRAYALGFVLAADAERHSLDVRVRRPDLKVYARKGFVR